MRERWPLCRRLFSGTGDTSNELTGAAQGSHFFHTEGWLSTHLFAAS